MPRTAQSAMIHILEGNPNNKTKKELYRRQKNEAKLAVSNKSILAPPWLSTGAKNEFNRIKVLFETTDILTEADINILAIYCDTLMDYKSFKAQVKKHGIMIGGKINPAIREKQKSAELLNKLANQLGLTPTARASMAINLGSRGESSDDEEF